ncbi:MAG: dihydrolipoamide acetyltransferase family protein [Candidatus Methylomirabilales bacterium]
MVTEVVMPKMGYDMTEGTIVQWRKQEGDEVKWGEVIAEVDTTKVTVEVEAYGSGVLRQILVAEGRTVPVGHVIALIADRDESLPELVETMTPSIKESPKTETKPAEVPVADIEQAPERIAASPVARQIAREQRVDLRLIRGTGPGGRIIKDDVETFLQQREAEVAKPAPAPVAAAPTAAIPKAAPQEMPYEERDLSRIRQTIARRMAESKRVAPHFYVTTEIDMTEVLKLRNGLNAVLGEKTKVSVTDMLVKATAHCLQRFPEVNASFAEGKIRIYQRINIGIAVALEQGLVTPVIPDCDRKPLTQIAQEAKELVERARAGRLRAEDLTPGTFTISNLGMFDVDEFVAVINPPEAAVLAVGSVVPRPVVVEGEVKVSERMRVTLSADHRVVDGAVAARFLQHFKVFLEQPLHLVS